jgi:hypothetical protein
MTERSSRASYVGEGSSRSARGYRTSKDTPTMRLRVVLGVFFDAAKRVVD